MQNARLKSESPQVQVQRSLRATRGRANGLSGASAEAQVLAAYQQRGYRLVAQRWRAARGEIDLIVMRDGLLAFVEVKKSSSFARAAERLQPAQIARIFATAEAFLASAEAPDYADIRMDVALVDQYGRLRVMPGSLQRD